MSDEGNDNLSENEEGSKIEDEDTSRSLSANEEGGEIEDEDASRSSSANESSAVLEESSFQSLSFGSSNDSAPTHDQSITVAISNNTEKEPPPSPTKPYLGGYRNKLTGVEYHHAKVQTNQAPWKYNTERFERDVQTAETKTVDQQTIKDNWTQVQVRGIYLPTIEEKIIEPSDNYVSADEIQERVFKAIITIQRYWRRWLARKALAELRVAALKQVLWDKEEEWLMQKEEMDWFNELQERRLYPRTKDDFLLLFGDLKKWWQGRKAFIEMRKDGAAKKAEMCMVLDEEVQHLEGIENLKHKAHILNTYDSRNRFLEETGKPKTWKAYKGEISVETAGTLKGRSLHQLYVTLCMDNLTVEQRVDALMTLKKTIKPHDFPLTRNLASLANREIDLLLRGTRVKALRGLQLRIRNLFWQFARQPAFNPEALRLSKLKTSDGSLPSIFTCSACNQYYIQSADETNETASVLQQRFTKCKNCQYVENEGWSRKDLEVYKRMLKLLRASEEKKKTRSGIIYLLQPNEICFMVEKIWQSQSALSGVSVLKDLEFVRWSPEKNWTPWNCVLMTRKEAKMHYHLEDPQKQYEDSFSQSVYKKHMSAQGYFSTIPRFFPYLRAAYQKTTEKDSSNQESL